jgi:hypothetical protein
MQLRRPKGRQNRRPIQILGVVAEPCQVDHNRLPPKKIRLLLAHPFKRFLQRRRRGLPKHRTQRGCFESFEFDGWAGFRGIFHDS